MMLNTLSAVTIVPAAITGTFCLHVSLLIQDMFFHLDYRLALKKDIGQ